MQTDNSTAEALAWDGVRTVRAKRHPEGWTLEMALPLGALGWNGQARIG